MGLKRLLEVCAFLMTGLMAVASAALVGYKAPDAPPEDRLIPISVNQLPLENGVFPVEMRCAAVRSPAPNQVEPFSCLAINHTRKKISALAVEYSVVTEAPGGPDRDTSVLTSDFAFHPDVTETMGTKLLAPGESSRVEPPGTATFESGTVTGVEVRIDHVEFEDKTSIGSGTRGAKMVGSMRAGAVKYKAWLVRQYKRAGKDEEATASLLDDGELPKELDFDSDPDLAEGARLYRRVMRRVYTSQGASELKRHLNN